MIASSVCVCVCFCDNHRLNNVILIRSVYWYIFMLSVVVSVCLACCQQVNFSEKDVLFFFYYFSEMNFRDVQG